MVERDRDATRIATRPSLAPDYLFDLSPLTLNLLEIEDNRLFFPDVDFGGTIHGGRARVHRSGRYVPTGLKTLQYYFERSPEVARCVRRKNRREVLFALRRTRSGRGKRKRRNAFSNVRC